MLPSPHRTNLHDLTSQIVKLAGPDRAAQYFTHFRSFLSARLTKAELHKVVFLTIGRENVSLHNQLIKAVLSNALLGQVPPSPAPPARDTSRPVKGIRRRPPLPFGNNADSTSQNPASPTPSTWPNGESFGLSLCKGKSGIRDRKANKERLSPLGPLGGGKLFLSERSLVDKDAAKSGANDKFEVSKLPRLFHEIQGAAEQPIGESNNRVLPSAKRSRMFLSTEGMVVEGNEEENLNTLVLDERDTVHEWDNFLLQALGPVRAPLGIPLCPDSIGSARKSPFVGMPPHLVNGKEDEFIDISELPDVETMQNRINQIASVEGVQDVSRDCAVLVNQALDIVLKRLLKSCINSVEPRSYDQDQTVKKVSLLDFKVAMELNPQQLGEDWPITLEEISFRLFEH